jgi:HAD superfamily hydrolase (TIGR01484 family)
MASEKLRPLAEFPQRHLAAVKAVLLDIDDTLSTEGHLTAEAYAALERLKRAGLLVLPITGRPAGWCDMIARFWPVDAVVGENGAFYFWHDKKANRLRQRFLQSEAERADGRRKLEAVRETILREVPGAGIASDQPYRVADLAVDFCEDVKPLPRADVERIVALFQQAGATAKVSSIHVNGWFGSYDKLGMTRLALKELFNIDVDAEKERIVFAGDSPNDAPMFGFFPNAVGVANLRDFGDLVSELPHWITEKRAGAGFVELAQALLSARP